LLAEVIDTSGFGATGSIELEYHTALVEQLKPWYLAALNQDTEAKRVAAAILAGEDPDGDTSDPRTFMRAVFREGLAPAMRTDPVVLRAVMRTMNLLASPESLLTDPEVSSRVLSMYNDREHRPPEPELGPRARVDLLASIGV
jgi:hypothetical protein